MGILTRIDNGISAFKSAFSSGRSVSYSRLENGDHEYIYDDLTFGAFSFLNLGDKFSRPKQNLKYYYANTLFLQDCINLYADFASQVRIIEVDEKGNEVENSEYVNFLTNPNPLQTGTEFIKEMIINCLSTGASFQYGNYFKNGNLKAGARLYNLEFNNLSFPKIKNKYELDAKGIKNLVLKEHLADGKKRDVNFFELAYFYDTIPNNGWSEKGYDESSFFKPMARLFSILPSLNTLLNTQASMQYMTGNNVNKILSKESLAPGAVATLGGDQKEDIERKISGRDRYGMKAGKIGDTIATNESLKLLDLTRDNRKMQMIEMKESAKEDVRNCFLIPKDFFGDSTYENKQFSEARFILGNAKPLTDNWLQTLVNKTPEYFASRKTKLVGSYDHLPSISETKKKLENEGFLARTKALDAAIATYNNMVTIQPGLTWDEFIRVNQFNDYLMIKS